jgi:adenine phosphoribosyltransferase
VIHPITDGIPEITPDLLEEITDEFVTRIKKYKPFEKIVTIEAMGIPLATALSLRLNLPFTILRKRCYQLPKECSVTQITGYSTSELFINGINKNESIIIVDDVLSTGGTLKAVLETLKHMQVRVKGVFIAVDKGTSAKSISSETNIPINSLVHIQVVNGSIVFEED